MFFGPAARPLFGVLHPAALSSHVGFGDLGVVLCGPGPYEARQAHQAIRTLAERLAGVGLPVLRFDYACTGDSAGAAVDACFADWVDDIATAAAELRDAADVRRVAFVGLRLGAAVVARAIASGLGASDLVLWDPIVSGRTYIAGLAAGEAARLAETRYPVAADRGRDELAGIPTSAAFRAELEAIDLLTDAPNARALGAPGRVTLVTAGQERPEWRALAARYAAHGFSVTRDAVDELSLADPQAWRCETLRVHAGPAAILARLVGRPTERGIAFGSRAHAA